MAGYNGVNIGQAAYLMERNNPAMLELIEALNNRRRIKSLADENSEINRELTAKASQDYAEHALEIIENADGETARRIKFYRDIADGVIKTVKKTTEKDGEGKVKKVKVEEVSDITARIAARKELDRILGLNKAIELGNVQVGDITINIVDASRKDALEDDRNKVVLDIDNVQVIDGKECLVTEETVSQSKKDQFFESVGGE